MYLKQKYTTTATTTNTNKTTTTKDANICFIFTEWGEIKAVEPETFKNRMRIPLVYDGRNLYDLEAMRAAGVEYYSIGR